MNKILVICGPTATGKTALALKLAPLFQAQLISADSRQVYRRMDIGTGKDLPPEAKLQKTGEYLIGSTKLWGYDLVDPDQEFSVTHFLQFARSRIQVIWQESGLPIVVGGTGLYLKALSQPLTTIAIPPNFKLRQVLSRLSLSQLQARLQKLEPKRFQLMNQSDRHNPRRLIRAIEISSNAKPDRIKTLNLKADFLWLGLTADKQILDQRIESRVEARIQAGAQQELESLLKAGYSFDLPSMSALGYRQWQPFFEGKRDLAELKTAWIRAEKQYLRRQLTWFKKMSQICWFDLQTPNLEKKLARIIAHWYTKKHEPEKT